MLDEIGHAARRLLKDRWSSAAAILVAALGTGLNVAVFAVAYGVLVRPLPYREAPRLATTDVSVPLARIGEWRDRLTSFEHLSAYMRLGYTVRGLDEPRYVPVAVVDDAFFETLGTRTLAGRTFDRTDTAALAVVSQRLARQAGGSADSPVGRDINVGGTAATVIGIMPEGFAFPSDGIDVWIPGRVAPAVAFDGSDDERRFRLFGLLKPGTTLAHARDDVGRVRGMLDPPGEGGSEPAPRIDSLYELLTAEVRPVLLAFAASAGIVLLIASANVATILIGRTIARRRELAVRTALGAGRGRLVLTVFSESITIALAGSILGTALAVLAVRLIATWGAGLLPRLADVRVDSPVLAFGLTVAALASMLAAVPALRALDRTAIALRTGGAGGTPAGVRIRASLAVSQIALAVLLLGAGGLLARTIVGLLREGAGVEARGAVVTTLVLTDSMRFEAAGQQVRVRDILEGVRTIPGVVAAGAGSSLPPANVPMVITARFSNGATTVSTPEISLASVTPGYLEALGARLLQGRYFEAADDGRGDPVTVLSASAARAFLPDVDPVGRQLPVDLPGMRDRRATVVGVIADVKYSGLESAAGPAVYVLWNQLPASPLYLALRTSGDGLAAAPALRTVLREVDPAMPVMAIRRLDEVLQLSVAERRARALLGVSVALLAFAIALVGLAGGLGRMVSERRYELAIRAALGASPSRALRTVLADGAAMAAAGVALGTGCTLAAGGLLRSLVFGVSPHDPATLTIVAAFVLVASLLVCCVPARRAAAANPLDVLREA